MLGCTHTHTFTKSSSPYTDLDLKSAIDAGNEISVASRYCKRIKKGYTKVKYPNWCYGLHVYVYKHNTHTYVFITPSSQIQSSIEGTRCSLKPREYVCYIVQKLNLWWILPSQKRVPGLFWYYSHLCTSTKGYS